MNAGRDVDCGYRALAAAFKVAAGETQEKATSAAKNRASLRARAATWILKKRKFRESFAIDDNWKRVPSPRRYEEWVESLCPTTVLDRRPGVYCCGDGLCTIDFGPDNTGTDGGVAWRFTSPTSPMLKRC